MDSSVSPTYGDQEGSAYNGHFGCTCYHPLFVFNQFGDLERSLLRPGNVHSAEDWRLVLEPVVERYRLRTMRSGNLFEPRAGACPGAGRSVILVFHECFQLAMENRHAERPG